MAEQFKELMIRTLFRYQHVKVKPEDAESDELQISHQVKGLEGNVYKYKVGTLRYTLPGLILTFLCIFVSLNLFGYTGTIVNTLIPLRMAELDIAPESMALLIGTLPAILNMIVTPVVSFYSDRYRSKWGRRMPYVLWAAPLIALSIVGIGWSGALGHLINPNSTTAQIVLLVICILGFQISWLVVDSVIWYIFPDIIPDKFYGRFFALNNLFGSGMGFFYNIFIMEHIAKHMGITLTITGIGYLLVMIFMFFTVREGDYPPVVATSSPQGVAAYLKSLVTSATNNPAKFFKYVAIVGAITVISVLCLMHYKWNGIVNTYQYSLMAIFGPSEIGVPVFFLLLFLVSGCIGGIVLLRPDTQTYIRECFSIPFYYTVFMTIAMNKVSLACRAIFNILFVTQSHPELGGMGWELVDIKWVGAAGYVVGLIISYPVGMLVDKFKAMKVYAIGMIMVIFANIYGFFFIEGIYSYFVTSLMLSISYSIQYGSEQPLFIDLMPKEQYGQFSSANAIFRAFLYAIFVWVGGMFIGAFGYIYLFAWDAIFTITALIFYFLMYVGWRHYGGPHNYVAPVRAK